jgi:hypothetical protein
MIFNGKQMTVFGAVTPAGIDDGVIAADVLWSSKGVVDALCPAINEKGKVVQCEPVAGYPLEVRSYFSVNDRYQFATLMRCGKNLYNKDVYPLTAGKYIATSGSPTQYSPTSNYACTEKFIPVAHLQGKQITLNHPPEEIGGGNPRMVFYTNQDVNTKIDEGMTNGYTTTVPTNAVYMRFSVPKDYADGTQIQIEIGSAVTEYEPYYEDKWYADFGDSVDGNRLRYLDWTMGILCEDGGEMQVIATPNLLGKAGCNTFFCDAGETEVMGRSDLLACINKAVKTAHAANSAEV